MKKTILLKNSVLKRHPALLRLMFTMLFISVFSTFALAQNVIKGVVKDETGSPMPGVNVILKGTTIGSTTDAAGEYSIEIPAGNEQGTLIVSFIGYLTEEQAIAGKTLIDVNMTPNIETLSEVVVVGYGVQRKGDVTGALVQVKEQALRDVPAANVTLALQGQVAGVQIDRTSSRPGGNMQIRIRGSHSLPADVNSGVSDPLVVVDGIPFNGNINDLDQNDIVSIDILKDASATAIYGSRGSNGVVLVTTRRGKKGKAQLSYDGYYGVSSILDKYDLYSGDEYTKFKIESNYNGGLAGTGFTLSEQQNLIDGRYTDWQDAVYQKGFITNHAIGVNGGSDDTQYSIGAGYYKETTVLPGQEFGRYSLRGTVDQTVGTRIKFGLNTLNTVNVTDGENASPLFQLLTMSPLYNAYNTDGTINELPAAGSQDPNTVSPLLLYRKDQWSQQRRRLRSFNSLYAEVKITEGLKYRLNVGLDYYSEDFGQYFGSNTPMVNRNVNTAQNSAQSSFSYTLENLLIYDKTFAEKHKVNFTGLYSVQEVEFRSFQTNVQDVFANEVQYYNPALANTLQSATGNYNRTGILSYMGRINYSYDGRYMLTLTGRRDGSSRLAEGNKYFNYPAAAVAWNVHNEAFMQDVRFLTNLKLRLGYGKTSNQAIGAYSSLGGLARIPYNFGPTQGTYGFYVQNAPNPNLTWEFTSTTNLGIDIGLFKNRVTASVEVYKSLTSDILQNRTLPPTSGISGSYAENVGKMENKGIEVTLSGNIIQADNGFNWGLDLNYYVNRQEITQLIDTIKVDIQNGYFIGQPVDVIYDYKKIGIYQNTPDDINLATAYGQALAPGDIKVNDMDHNGILDANDRTIIGSTQPKWQGGFTSRFSFKGIDLSIVGFARVGGMLVSTLYQSNVGNPYNTLSGRRNGPDVDYWTAENPTNAYPKPNNHNLGEQPAYGSTLGYFDATFFKIRTISLGYKLPAGLLDRTGISSVRIYGTINNPFKAFFSPYVDHGGLDPEATGRGGAGNAGWGNRLTVQPNTPLTKSFIVGLSIKY